MYNLNNTILHAVSVTDPGFATDVSFDGVHESVDEAIVWSSQHARNLMPLVDVIWSREKHLPLSQVNIDYVIWFIESG